MWIFHSTAKKRRLTSFGECAWKGDCPSHKPWFNARKPKLKLIERIGPITYKYQCGYCGMITLVDVSDDGTPANYRPHMKNPSLIGGSKWI